MGEKPAPQAGTVFRPEAYTGEPDLPVEPVTSPLDWLTLSGAGGKGGELAARLLAGRFLPRVGSGLIDAVAAGGAKKLATGALGGAATVGGFGAAEDVAEGRNPLPNLPANLAAGAVGGPVLEAAGVQARRLLPARPVPPPPPEPPAIVQRLTQAIQSAGPVRKETERLYSAERSARAGKGAAMMERAGGEKGYHAALGALKGELPKAQFEGVRSQFGQAEVDDLYRMIQGSELPFYEKVHAQSGLSKLLGVQGGLVPQASELSLLRRVYGAELVEAALKQRPFLAKAMEGVVEFGNIPRSIMSSIDLSAPFRQGLFLVRRPEFWQGWGNMVRSFGSEKVYQSTLEEIGQRPTRALMDRARLAITEAGPVLQEREERFLSNYAEKLPVVGPMIRASGRAYTAFLSKLRADTFDTMVRQARAAGHEVESDSFLSGLGSYINAATGRGPLGAFENAAPAFNAVLFSPRLFASRIALLNPAYYAGLPAPVRREALKDALALGGLATTAMGLAAAGGAKVGADPRNADFAKIRVGNTRYDILGGFQQPIRLLAQLASGQVISSTTGRTIRLNDVKGYRPLTRADIVGRFIKSKENPVASFVTEWLEGRNFEGKPFNVPQEIMNRLYPMALGDVYETVKEMGATGLIAGAPTLFGLGVQTYGPRVQGPGGEASLSAGEAAEFEQQLRAAAANAEQELRASGLLEQLSEREGDRKLERLVESRQSKVRRSWQARKGVLYKQTAPVAQGGTR